MIVVGPVESNTARYKDHARRYAALARSLGASVTEVYSPYATWTRVKSRGQGREHLHLPRARQRIAEPVRGVLAAPAQRDGPQQLVRHGNSNVKYWGQTYVKTLDLASNSVVLLNHLCYASGNSEPGHGTPSKSTAMQRADGYGTGFLRTGAKAVFANGRGSLSSILTDLLTSDKSVGQIFQDDWSFTGERDFTFASRKTPGATVWMDPYAKGKYYKAVNGKLSLTAAQVRAGD